MRELLEVLEWFDGRDTGMSSEAIAHHMSRGTCRGDHPWDPDDLGRCLRLLKRFPQWRPRLSEMGRYNPQWKRLSERWDEVSACMLDEVGIAWEKANSAPITYALMKEVIGDPCERYPTPPDLLDTGREG